MKILVTGASGFIGGHLVPRLLEHGHEVIAVARNESKASEYPWFDRVRFISSDVHNLSETPSLRELNNPDALIHLAWSGLPNYNELFHFEDNLYSDYRYIKSLVCQGLKHVMVTGTCFEYGLQNGCLREGMPTFPENPYALAKETLRKFLELLQLQNHFTFQWVRLFYMYGEGQNPNSLLAQLDSAIERGDKFFNMSGGEQLRDYLPVDKVAQYIADLVEHAEINGIYNCCSGEPISVRTLVERHIQNLGANIELNLGHYPYPTYEPMAFWGYSNKLIDELNRR